MPIFSFLSKFLKKKIFSTKNGYFSTICVLPYFSRPLSRVNAYKIKGAQDPGINDPILERRKVLTCVTCVEFALIETGQQLEPLSPLLACFLKQIKEPSSPQPFAYQQLHWCWLFCTLCNLEFEVHLGLVADIHQERT